MVADQILTENYAIYNSDSMLVLPNLESESIDLSIYSPPFAGLYKYTSLPNDLSNCASNDEFFTQYEFFVKEISRLTKPGRLSAVHVTDIVNTSTNELYDFPHDVIEVHRRHGFKLVNRIGVWKEPLTVKNRTMVKSLMHKTLCNDSTKCYTAAPDMILLFRRNGDNKVPVSHPHGMQLPYKGFRPMLDEMKEKYGTFDALIARYKNHKDPATNKLSHIIWQRYASSHWDDIRLDNVLPFRDAKDEEDEKHVHPLQLDVIERLVELYSNPNETVLTPFMGVGSEVYGAVINGRKGIGIELKESYFKQSILNLKDCKPDEDDTEKQGELC